MLTDNINFEFKIDGTKLIWGRNEASITIPDGITIIEREAFIDCDKLSSVIISKSVTEICDYAFASCPNLTKITIPENVRKIGMYAFYCDSNLIEVTISKHTEVEKDAFKECHPNLSFHYY